VRVRHEGGRSRSEEVYSCSRLRGWWTFVENTSTASCTGIPGPWELSGQRQQISAQNSRERRIEADRTNRSANFFLTFDTPTHHHSCQFGQRKVALPCTIVKMGSSDVSPVTRLRLPFLRYFRTDFGRRNPLPGSACESGACPSNSERLRAGRETSDVVPARRYVRVAYVSKKKRNCSLTPP
jgi:hypothetical protein